MQQLGTLPGRKLWPLLQQTALIIAFFAASASAMAQLPGHTITITVPYSPGTGPDILARTIGEELQHRWNQSVVVENKPGASGNLGTQSVARAAPDGNTLVLVSPSPPTSACSRVFLTIR
jgi:tripartite-type tricarboxylate transporter receptor subunit TctC